MITADYCRMMVRYHGWQNSQLTQVLAQLSTAQLLADRGAFFSSILGTLNHLLIVDALWLSRFLGQPSPQEPLDSILHSNQQDFAAARTSMDGALQNWVDGVTQAWLDSTLSFTALADSVPRTVPTTAAVLHLFNHGTHHRGQATTLLTSYGVDPGVTDLVRMDGLEEFSKPTG